MPSTSSRGYAWRGRRACQCVIDATADYERLARSSLTGYIYQACYSFAAASAGTHGGGGALDTVPLTDRGLLISRTIGFWGNNRTRGQGFSMDHGHWVLFGCPHAPAGLRFQEAELRKGRNGLANRGRDTGPRPSKILTYRQWKATQAAAVKKGYIRIGSTVQKDLVRMSVGTTNRCRARRIHARETWYVQRWLRTTGHYKGTIDGRWGPVTQAAFDRFRRGLGWPARDCIGPVGLSSLTRLAKAAGSTKPVIK